MLADRGVGEAAASYSNGRLPTYFGWLQIGDGGLFGGFSSKRGPQMDMSVPLSLSNNVAHV